MSQSVKFRSFLTSPTGAAALIAVAVLAWALTLGSHQSEEEQLLDKGMALARSHKVPAAEEAWRQAAIKAPNDPRPWNYLAELALSAHQWSTALEALKGLQAADPKSPGLLGRMAQCSLALGDEQGAYHTAEQALASDPNDADTIALFCGLLSYTGENQRRLDLLQRLHHLRPQDLAAEMQLAATLADKRQFDQARPFDEDVLRRQPGNLEARSVHGMIVLNTSSTPAGLHAAEADFLQTARSPGFAPFAHFNLGKIYARLGERDKAIEHLKAAAASMPYERSVWFELSEAYRLQKRDAEAGAALARSESLLASDKQIAALEKQVATQPGDFAANLALGQKYLDRQDYRRASISLDRAKLLQPGSGAVLAALAKVKAAAPAPTGK